MFHYSFKSLELLRYHVSSNFNNTFDNFTREYKNISDQLASAIFSAVFGFFLSNIVDCLPKTPDADVWQHTISLIVKIFIFIIGYIIAFLVYLKASKKIKHYYNSVKIRNINSDQEVKHWADDFDHIACDYVLISLEFQRRIPIKDDIELTTFYFYEALYYLEVAVKKTIVIVRHPEVCINTKQKVDFIDVYRIVNLHNMMCSILTGLISQKGQISISNNLTQSLDNKLCRLKENVDYILTQCEEHICNNF